MFVFLIFFLILFKGHVLELVIVYYDAYPKIPTQNAQVIISNLVSLFKHIKLLNIHPRFEKKIKEEKKKIAKGTKKKTNLSSTRKTTTCSLFL